MGKRFGFGLTVLIWLVVGATRAQAEYIVTDLGMTNWQTLGPSSLNNLGQVTLDSAVYENGHFIHPDPPGSVRSVPVAINDAGQVLIQGSLGSLPPSTGMYPPYHAYLYSGGKFTDLSNLPGQTQFGNPDTIASAMNNLGQVVGQFGGFGAQHAFLYSGGRMIDLTTKPGIRESSASGINDRGQVIGSFVRYYTYYQWVASVPVYGGFLYDHGKVTDLGNHLPAAINDNGQIVANHSYQAYLYSQWKMEQPGYTRNGFCYRRGSERFWAGRWHGSGLQGRLCRGLPVQGW